MTECPNESMRDLLPGHVHGTLAPADEARVRTHVATCASCAAELALIGTTRRVLRANAPRVDVAAVLAAVTAPSLTVVRGGAGRGGRRATWMPRRYLAAAASLLVIGALALPAVRRVFDGVTGPVAGDSLADVAAASPEATGLTLAGGLGDLTDADLATLLAELDAVEATVASEPATLRTPLVDPPEGP